MPSLFRFLFLVAILAGLVFGGMFALATFYKPTPRETSVEVRPPRLAP